ncbi:uncharacterized protein LOC122518259 [Polistes fuscatus]|uniref:uncharacterized protein LOC122518259 n=1 Tax=Polistes fuscatus TaxID=30207 RepID=UPI001CA87184|nr:uncharacterized protein LOC122518259 [Polistes fuscatus]
MILIVYVVLLLGLNHVESEELPTIFEVENSINRTIDQVERLINENPNLPRLSRNDIVDILYNITSKDSEAYENKDQIEKARKMYQRALMVVLPYKARESLENLKDLYTKPPIVQMLSDSASGERLEMVLNDRSKESNSGSLESTDNVLDKSRYKNHRETYSDVRSKESLKETLTPGSAPMRFSFNLESLQTNHHYPTRETTRIDDRPIFLPTTGKTIDDDRVEDINVVLDAKNAKETSGSEELTIDLGPKQDILYSDQWHYNAPPPQNVPDESKEEFSFGEIEREENESSTIFVTPLALTSQTSKYNTTLALNSGGFRDATSTTEKISTEPTTKLRVMDLLASIGLRPENEANVDNVFPTNRPKVSNENGIVSLDADEPDSPLIEDQNTFRTGGFDLNKGMENLTPDLRLLFQKFGIESTQDRQSPSVTTTTRTTTNLYRNFKPLPTSTVQDEEMREFLSRFGLGVNRQRKAMKSKVPSVIEAVPVNMRTVLENIGLISSSRRNSKNSIQYSEETKTTPKYHVFKPHETIFKNDDERSKINELLDTVKLVQEGKADTKDVRKVASDLLKNTKTLSVGPDPLSLDEIIRVYSGDLKNEVKRQKEDAPSSTSEGNSPTSTTISPIETTTLMDSAKDAAGLNETTATTESEPMPTTTTTAATTTTTNTNLIDLENSFGGSTRAPDPVLPARRKTGLYFLVDWNTFLEVGEEGSEKINLRFQPKVGDRSRFLPVTVP